MKKIRQKMLKIIDTELDNIIEYQNKKQEAKLIKNPIFENFDENFSKKLKEHDEFIKRISNSIHSTMH